MSKYVLALQDTHNKIKINIKGKNYLLYANSYNEACNIPKNDFNLKEKLYILNYSINVVWIPISYIHYILLRAFNSLIKPKQLVIKPVNGKVIINVNKQ